MAGGVAGAAATTSRPPASCCGCSRSPGTTALGFLGSASNGPSKGDGTITYTDGSTQAFTLDLSDWTLGGGGGTPDPGNVVAVATPYRNNPGGRDNVVTNLFSASVPLQAGRPCSR